MVVYPPFFYQAFQCQGQGQFYYHVNRTEWSCKMQLELPHMPHAVFLKRENMRMPLKHSNKESIELQIQLKIWRQCKQ